MPVVLLKSLGGKRQKQYAVCCVFFGVVGCAERAFGRHKIKIFQPAKATLKCTPTRPPDFDHTPPEEGVPPARGSPKSRLLGKIERRIQI